MSKKSKFLYACGLLGILLIASFLVTLLYWVMAYGGTIKTHHRFVRTEPLAMDFDQIFQLWLNVVTFGVAGIAIFGTLIFFVLNIKRK